MWINPGTNSKTDGKRWAPSTKTVEEVGRQTAYEGNEPVDIYWWSDADG
jgi:hypothetical protein